MQPDWTSAPGRLLCEETGEHFVLVLSHASFLVTYFICTLQVCWSAVVPGHLLSVAESGEVCMWTQTAAQKLAMQLDWSWKDTEALHCVTWAPHSGLSFATGSGKGTINVWDLQHSRTQPAASTVVGGGVRCLRWIQMQAPVPCHVLVVGDDRGLVTFLRLPPQTVNL